MNDVTENNFNNYGKQDPRIDTYLKEFEEDKSSKIKSRMKKNRQNLPIFSERQKILELIRKNPVVMIKGETGCGKTTQVAQYILEDCIERDEGSICKIVCTQPRRISAMGVANRVAEERGERIGNDSRQESTVGYEIRFDSEKPRDVGSITFCTTGIVLQRLRNNPDLSEISHIILDEVHERDLFTDILIGVLNYLVSGNNNIKLIVMSASLDVDKFSSYLKDCPVVDVKGRTFPVVELYLEDFHVKRGPRPVGLTVQSLSLDEISNLSDRMSSMERVYKHAYGNSADDILDFENRDELDLDVIAKLVLNIHNDYDVDSGAILIFLPGWDEISKLGFFLGEEYLSDERDNPNWLGDNVDIHYLHSQVEMKKQARVFKPAPQGKRKVILSTNIAETSVTIDDVVYVVDCGRINISRYIPLQKAANLTMEWISQSNALQRAGRAGRVQAGKCWHMFSRARWCELEEYLDPDIKRQALEEVIINIKSLHLPWKYAAEFMDNLIESPKSTNVNDAVDLLVNIEAINDNHNEQLTPLGHKLAHLPLHPQLGKMLVLAALFKCVDPILTIVAILNEKDPFMLQGFKNRDKLDKIRRSFSQGYDSDHLMFANVVKQWENAYNSGNSKDFCNSNCLSEKILLGVSKIKDQLTEKLEKLNLTSKKKKENNIHSTNFALVKGVIASALFPLVKIIKVGSTKKSMYDKFPYLVEVDNKRIYINQKSVNERKIDFDPDSRMAYFFARGNKKGTLHVHDCTIIPHVSALLFTPLGNNEAYGQIPELKRRMKSYINASMASSGIAGPSTAIVTEIADFVKNYSPY